MTLSIPPIKIPMTAFASQGNAILGIKGSGKSYGATYLAERLLEAGIPFVAFDPIGVWRYLKVPGNGKGFPVVVAHPENGDLPLTPQSAPEIVRAAMRENVPLVIDLYSIRLSKADWRTIVETCIRILLYENKTLRHVFIEEAAEFCPQRIGDQQGKVYAEIEKLARMGGNASLGYTLINQRAEEVNKAVLEICDCLILHRQRGKNSLMSLSKWLDFANKDTAKEIIASLPTLGPGDCWIWQGESGLPVRCHFPTKESFHPDRKKPELIAKAGKPLDVGQFVTVLKGSLEKVVAESKANDPAELKKEIHRLKSELDRVLKQKAPEQVPVFSKEQIDKFRHELDQSWEYIRGAEQRFRDSVDRCSPVLEKACTGIFSILEAISSVTKTLPKPNGKPFLRIAAKPKPALERSFKATRIQSSQPSDSERITGGLRAILTACAQYSDSGCDKTTLSVLTGYKSTSLYEYTRQLQQAGLIGTDGSGRFVATPEGIARLGDFEPLPEGVELIEYWRNRLSGGELKIFELIVAAQGSPVDRESIMEQTGFKGTSVYEYSRQLLARKIIEKDGTLLKLADKFFQ